MQTPWAWTDTVASWSWNVPEGSPVTVDVYSDANEVELLLNNRSLGTATVGAAKPFLARFETTYEAGTLTAVARTAGREQARSSLSTASGPLHLSAVSDRTAIRADDMGLAYVAIELQDADGNLATDQDRDVSVTVAGPGIARGARHRPSQTEGASMPRTAPPMTAARSPSSDRCRRALSRSRSAPTAMTPARSRCRPNRTRRRRDAKADGNRARHHQSVHARI